MSYYNPRPDENDAYRHLWQVATKGTSSTIGGPEAVRFFVASGLPVPTLKQVWAIASNGQKEMGPREFSTAMRLIALAQSGQTIDESTLGSTQDVVCGWPRFQGIEMPSPQQPVASPPTPTASSAGAAPTSWAILPEQRSGYEKLWNNLQKNPQGLLEGKDAAAFFAKSGQSRDVLRAVWQMADVGGDGLMDQAEFMIGMHLTMMAKKGAPLPSTLPADLQRSAAAPFERSTSNTSQLSASMMQMMQPSNQSLLGESDRDMSSSSSRLLKQNSARSVEAPASGASDTGSDYDSLRQDMGTMNNSLAYAAGRMDESRTAIKGQVSRTSNELSALKAERERLMQALTEATNAFQADAEKLKSMDEELMRLRDEVSRLRQGVDAKRAAIGAQQDLIGARIDETRALTKQMAGASVGGPPGADLKRRNPPVPPPGQADFFQDSGFPSGDTSSRQPAAASTNAFDAFDDPYVAQGSGGKSNEY